MTLCPGAGRRRSRSAFVAVALVTTSVLAGGGADPAHAIARPSSPLRIATPSPLPAPSPVAFQAPTGSDDAKRPTPAAPQSPDTTDPSQLSTERLREICLARAAAEAEAFDLEIADYGRKLSNNPPGSVAVRAAIDSIVARGEIAVDFLLEALVSETDNLSANAALALIRFIETGAVGSASERVYEATLAILRSKDHGAGIRKRSAEVLVQFRDTELAGRLGPDLLAWLPKETSESVLLTIVDALGRRKHAPATQLLADLVDDSRFRVRAAAISALGRIGAPSSIETIARGLTDDSLEVRGAAYRALAAVGTPPAARPIHPRLTELGSSIDARTPVNDPRVKEIEWALSAIADIGWADSMSVLRPLVGSDSYSLVQQVLATIRAILDRVENADAPERALPEVLALVTNRPYKAPLVDRAFEVIVEIGHPDALPSLQQWLSHENRNIAVQAARALGEIGDRDSLAALKDRYREVSGQRGASDTLRYWLAYSIARLGEHSPTVLREITRSYEARLSRDDEDIDAMLQLGRIYREIGKYQRAITRYYTKALRELRNPAKRAEVMFDIGLCYAHLGEFERADDRFAEAARLGLTMNASLLSGDKMRSLARSDDENVREYYSELRRRVLGEAVRTEDDRGTRGSNRRRDRARSERR
jgi:HEAT repeat protein